MGSRVAYRLAERGCSVVVMEKKPDPGEPVCCTGILGRECIERFAIDKSVIYREASSASVFSPSGRLIHIERKQPQAYIVDRGSFNRYLAGLAMEKGAEYFLNCRAGSIDILHDRVKVEFIRGSGGKELLEARSAVIATGSGSRLVEHLGMRPAVDSAMGAQAEVETRTIDEVEVYLGGRTAPGFFAWLVPTAPGKGLAGLISRNRTGYYMKRLLAELAEKGKIAAGDAEIKYAQLALKPAPRTSGSRILVVGSAAGQVKPLTGGGVYYGLLCADIAAENLFGALKENNLTARRLANYDKQWKCVLGREIRLSSWSRKLYELLSDRQVDTLFDIITKNGIDRTLVESGDIEFDWHGTAVMKLVRHVALTGAAKAIGLPLPVRKKKQ